MAATSDEEMEKLLALADQISGDFTAGILEIETLKSNIAGEIATRQSLELTCSALKQENQRLKNLHLETLNNLLFQLQQRGNSRDLSSKLEKLAEESRKKEEQHRIEVESMRRSCEEKVVELEGRIAEVLSQKSADEAAIYRLHHEVIALREKANEVEVKCGGEVEDLRDCVFAEQQEKEELSKKVRELEKQLLVSRTRAGDQRGGSVSDKQLEVMKQKMMKLRRENEALKRQLNCFSEN